MQRARADDGPTLGAAWAVRIAQLRSTVRSLQALAECTQVHVGLANKSGVDTPVNSALPGIHARGIYLGIHWNGANLYAGLLQGTKC